MTHPADDINLHIDQLLEGLGSHYEPQSLEHLKLFGQIGAVSQLYNELVQRYLSQFDIMPIEQQVLTTLRAGLVDEPATLAKTTYQTRAGMTSTLDRLEKKDLLRRVAHETDRRRVKIQLTNKGKKLTDSIIASQNEALVKLMKGLAKKDQKVISDSMNNMINRFSATLHEK